MSETTPNLEAPTASAPSPKISRWWWAGPLLAVGSLVLGVWGWTAWKHHQFEKERTETPPHVVADLKLKLLWIPAGTFVVGSERPNEWLLRVKGVYNDAKPLDWPVWQRGPFPEWEEGPAREVRLSEGFFIGQTEVTQEQWVAIMGNNPSRFKGGKDSDWGLRRPPPFWRLCLEGNFIPKFIDFINLSEKWDKARVMTDKVPIDYMGGSYPVESVSWFRCLTFCQKLTERERMAGRLPAGLVYRLPTEEEWEIACRAGNPGRFSFGNDISVLHEYAWIGDDLSDSGPHQVGGKKLNAWGFYDMYGNVDEWCAGDYGIHDVPTHITDVASVRLLKGDSWGARAEKCGSAYRIGIPPDSFSCYWGLRIVLGPELTKAK